MVLAPRPVVAVGAQAERGALQAWPELEPVPPSAAEWEPRELAAAPQTPAWVGSAALAVSMAGAAWFGQNGQLGRQGTNGAGGQNGNGNLSKPIQINYDLGFDYTTPVAPQVVSKVSTQLSHSPNITAVGPIAVQMAGRTAILRGRVATAHDRDLAEQVALLRTRDLSNPERANDWSATDVAACCWFVGPSGLSLPDLPTPGAAR